MTDFDWPSAADVIAALAGLTAVSGSYAVAGGTPTFVASPVERMLSRAVPIELIVAAITALGDLGQQLNLLFAVVLVAVALAAFARVALVVGETVGAGAVAAPLTAVGGWALATVLAGDPLVALATGVPAGLAVAGGQLVLATATGRDAPLSSKRRRALTTIGAAAGIAGVGYVAGETTSPSATGERAPDVMGEHVDPSALDAALAAAREQELDAPVEPLVSDRFYEVDINAVDPNPDAEDWSLSVTGAARNSFTLSYDDVLAMPAEHRFVTLRCVGDALNGKKMDNALWTGVPVADLIERAGPTGDCGCVKLHAADGYFQVFPIEALRPGLLAFGMNGKVLPRGHGYPLRTLVPGHWGEINVKWLTEIEFLEQEAEGYWEQRGWHGTGPVVPVAKLHTTVDREDGRRLLGGHAYAGTRGVSRVEVSTDGGTTWNDAALSGSLSEIDVPRVDIDAEDVWRQWAYEYDRPGDSHTVVVRMVDGDGDVQPKEERGVFPRGASGWVSEEF